MMNESDKATKRQRAGVLNSACCACPRASRHSLIVHYGLTDVEGVLVAVHTFT